MAHYRATKHILVTLFYQVSTESTPGRGALIHGFKRINIHTLSTSRGHNVQAVLFSRTKSLHHKLLTPGLHCLGTLLGKNVF